MPRTCARDVVAADRVDVQAGRAAPSVGATPACSWSIERMRPSRNAVVGGLPRSWQTAPSMTVSCCGRSRSSMRPARLVDDEQRVHPDVALGMPFRLLRTTDERLQLGEELVDRRRARARARSPTDGRSARSSSFSISPQMRSAGRSSSGMRAAERLRVGVHLEPEPGGELDAAQHAQAVVAKRPRIDGAQHPALEQIAAAVERVEVGVGQRIPGDRVDREVAPPRRFLRRHVRIAAHRECAMAAADLRLAARQRRRRRRGPCRR